MGLPVLALLHSTYQRVKEGTFKSIKSPIFWGKFLAYLIPVLFLVYTLYTNYLPSRLEKTYTIHVGSENDTRVSEFYLQPSPTLSERKRDSAGATYRELNGMAKIAFEPEIAPKTTGDLLLTLEGENISFVKPFIDFKESSIAWEHTWNFSTTTPSTLKGTAFHFDDCAYFNGKSRLELVDTSEQFENGPFTVYAKWKPENKTDEFQEIIGHYNWEIVQNKNTITFRVGRMNDGNGPFYSIDYPVTDNFFNQDHYLLASYNVSNATTSNGYIDLLVDGVYAGRSYFGTSKIFKDYNGGQNLTFGKSAHGSSSYFKGCLYTAQLTSSSILPALIETDTLETKIKTNEFAIISNASTSLKGLTLYAK